LENQNTVIMFDLTTPKHNIYEETSFTFPKCFLFYFFSI